MRRIFLLLAALVAAWLFGRARRVARKQASDQPVEPPIADPMVRDRVCNTFLPRSRALVSGSGDDELFFCSPKCRDQYHGAKKAQ